MELCIQCISTSIIALTGLNAFMSTTTAPRALLVNVTEKALLSGRLILMVPYLLRLMEIAEKSSL